MLNFLFADIFVCKDGSCYNGGKCFESQEKGKPVVCR